uniref:Uncharacterized protein n=1 Tax=Oryza meridionalis TaxID=40149 RepID=A0A0E0ERM4_9ORYZ
MDSSNQKFIDLLSQDSPNHAEKPSHNSPPQQFPIIFPNLSLPKASTHIFYTISIHFVPQATIHHMVILLPAYKVLLQAFKSHCQQFFPWVGVIDSLPCKTTRGAS